MVLRQKALTESVATHLKQLHEVFADMDPVYGGTEMQDAGEFLLRLLGTMSDEIDACHLTDNPVREHFQHQILESKTCIKCGQTVMKHLNNICWFVNVPRRQNTDIPTLQEALHLSMCPERRTMLCQHCGHDESCVTSKISQLPRTLILQLNRCAFLGDRPKKIRASVGIPKILSLNKYVAVQTLAKLFMRDSDVRTERVKLRRCTQAPGQSSLIFLANLKEAAVKCAFGPLRDDMIRDQFVEGCVSEQLRDKLIMTDGLTLTALEAIAEAADRGAQRRSVLKEAFSPAVSGPTPVVEVAYAKETPAKDRVQGLKDMQQPSTKKKLQSVLGILGFYSKFVKNFSSRVEPLRRQLRKDAPAFKWTEEMTAALDDVLNSTWRTSRSSWRL
ncbi:Ubiquitin carboxyl-terminal hydrolase 37 [Amphibalanus amphitrite]|uniref:Ubiquitin carboxyl-terminal hydrolase 37 n=1 Tax=Amphibalanus amphitrite TaxID=1232801 RepID=A0A6A4VX51_AMPAM|nr:Ubiquitin carboxyl-terminal hydrolase 37 [Amphibalanus amphitrite]